MAAWIEVAEHLLLKGVNIGHWLACSAQYMRWYLTVSLEIEIENNVETLL